MMLDYVYLIVHVSFVQDRKSHGIGALSSYANADEESIFRRRYRL